MFTCVGCQYGVNAYILPSAECDLNMGSEEKGLLNVAFLIGNTAYLRKILKKENEFIVVCQLVPLNDRIPKAETKRDERSLLAEP